MKPLAYGLARDLGRLRHVRDRCTKGEQVSRRRLLGCQSVGFRRHSPLRWNRKLSFRRIIPRRRPPISFKCCK